MGEWWQTVEKNGWTVRSKRSGLADVQWVPAFVCVAMMGVLFVLVVEYANDSHRTNGCQTHMKVMTLGLLSYTQDYDERLPLFDRNAKDGAARFAWADDQFAQVEPGSRPPRGFALHCPADPTEDGTLSYALNARLYPTQVAPGVLAGVRLRDVAWPASVYAILEADTEHGAGNDGLLDPDREWPVARHRRRHDARTMVGYLDGHWMPLPVGQLRGRAAPNFWNPTPAKPEAKP
ncbi:MAG: hypothetical protein HZB16_10540 [Armatimonadetes bacterium]|nr:hypothetical protein [Armatimonadota bacterium]